MTRSKYRILTASGILLLTAALARAGLIWQTTPDAPGLGDLFSSVGAESLWDELTAPLIVAGGSVGGDPNTSGGTGGTGGTGGVGGIPGGSQPGGGGGVVPEPGTLILTGAGIVSALLLARKKRGT